MSEPRRVLVRAPSWVGDAVLATPALRALRAGLPDAEIVVEGRPVLEDLLRGLPHFDSFLADPGRGVPALLARTRALRAGRFDLALLLPDSVRAAIGPLLARVPRRIGYAREPLRRLLLSQALQPPREGGLRLPIPMTERYLRLTRHLGCADRGDHLELVVDPDAADRVEKELLRLGVAPSDPVMVVTPGAGFGPSKQWPPEHFAAACDGISRSLGLRPVLAPGPTEIGIALEVLGAAREPLVGVIDPVVGLEELKALVARSSLVLTNDTGPGPRGGGRQHPPGGDRGPPHPPPR